MHYFENKVEALSMIEHVSPGDVILVKASRAEEFNLLAESIREILFKLPNSNEVE